MNAPVDDAALGAGHTMPHGSPHTDVLIVGHVTRDQRATGSELGGTAAFSASAASCMGLNATVVTAAPRNFDLLNVLRQDPHIEVIEVPVAQETVFELNYTPNGRLLRVRQQAPALRLSDIPSNKRSAPLAYVAPILGECPYELIAGLQADVVMLSLQGALRKLAADGTVLPTITELAEAPPSNVSAVVFSELDHPEADALAQRLARRGILVALTRSVRGVSLYGSERTDVPAVPALEIDPTGAGDVFGLVLGLGLAAGQGPIPAARHAARAAARVVEGPGLGRLEDFGAALPKQRMGATA